MPRLRILQRMLKAVRVLDTVNPLTYGKTARAILDFKPDMMITKYWMPYFAPSLGTVAKRLKKKGVINISILDNVIPHEQKFYDKPLTRYFVRNNHGFVAMSQNVADDLLTFDPKGQLHVCIHTLCSISGKR